MSLTLTEAVAVAGKLSNTSKMPCPSWGIDPKHCAIGKRLRNQKGTTCSICYACKGMYNFPNVRNAQEVRFNSLDRKEWVEAMVVLITKSKCDHFRWLDSGDIQGRSHLLKIILIAAQLPEVNFWLPTQEHKLIRDCKHKIPANLKIRLTNAIIDPDKDLRNAPLMAEVHTAPDPAKTDGWICPAPQQGGKCEDCRACWDPNIRKVIYKKH
jgi:hypothetical protein